MCWCCYFCHPHCFYFCFFSARLFSGVTFWTVLYRAQMMIDNSKAYLSFFGTPSLLFWMFLCSNDNSFYDGVFVYVAIFFSLILNFRLVCNQNIHKWWDDRWSLTWRDITDYKIFSRSYSSDASRTNIKRLLTLSVS